MLATLNPKQIVDEIVKDTIRDNDPHDAIQIAPDVVLASRPITVAPALAPEVAPRPEPKFAADPVMSSGPLPGREPKFGPVSEPQQSTLPSVDTAIRISSEDHGVRKRSVLGKWLRGALVTFLLAGASAAATIAWHKHGDAAGQVLAAWTPGLASLLPSRSQTAPVAAAPASSSAQPNDSATAQAAVDQTVDQAQPAAQPTAATTSSDAAQSITRDLAAMAQQIEHLKAEIAELKAGQEQMARELAKPAVPRAAAADARLMDSHARAAATSPKPPAPPPARKPKPVVSRTYMPAYAPPPPVPPPSQAAAAPPAPVATTQAVADDDGPIVRPPMPLR